MFRYRLYLLDGEQNVFKKQLIPVEGIAEALSVVLKSE